MQDKDSGGLASRWVKTLPQFMETPLGLACQRGGGPVVPRRAEWVALPVRYARVATFGVRQPCCRSSRAHNPARGTPLTFLVAGMLKEYATRPHPHPPPLGAGTTSAGRLPLSHAGAGVRCTAGSEHGVLLHVVGEPEARAPRRCRRLYTTRIVERSAGFGVRKPHPRRPLRQSRVAADIRLVRGQRACSSASRSSS
ncbi:MAG: hypothetical protein KatS3mg054_0555 [Chloroflexus sp.]|nr:MAG: hypothetical protein KatS3mg054_0555 [Chloroflexus sp.]